MNYFGNFAQPHTGNGCGHFALVNVVNTGLLRSYHGESAWSFCVLCVQFILCLWHYIVHAWVICSTGLATLANVKQAHANPHATVFLKDETTTLFPHSNDMQQSMCYSYMFKTGSHQLLVIRMANTGTSKVDGDTKHLTFLG